MVTLTKRQEAELIRHEDSRGSAQAKQFGDKAREVTELTKA